MFKGLGRKVVIAVDLLSPDKSIAARLHDVDYPGQGRCWFCWWDRIRPVIHKEKGTNYDK